MEPAEPHGRARQFDATRWSLILQARGEGPLARSALETLCRGYWFPLYAFVRRSGYAQHDAEDLTQAFFTHIFESDFISRAAPERGRFRSFLLVSLRNFIAKQHAREASQKRGGGQRPVDFDESAAEARLAVQGPSSLTPGELFDRDWALALLEQALDRLEAEQRAIGKAELFARLRPLLRTAPQPGDYDALAAELGVAKGALTVAVHRLQQRYRALVRGEIAQTLASPADLDDELRYLCSLLSQ